jgi:hypothetical protein
MDVSPTYSTNEVKPMKKLMLSIALMCAFAATTSSAADTYSIPIPDQRDDIIEEVPLPPPGVPSCWPVCN